MKGPAYLLLDRDGVPLGLSSDRGEAIAMAQEIDPSGQIYLDAPTEQNYEEIEAAEDMGLAANARRKRLPIAAKIKNAPAESLRAVMKALDKRRIDFKGAMQMSLEEAHSKLVPLFPKNKYNKTGSLEKVGTYGTAKRMAGRFLGQNYKTQKETPAHVIETLFRETGLREASVMGLSLLPTTQSFRNEGVARIMDTASEVYGVQDVYDIRINSCVRATPECASSCLVFSGHNLSDDYNTVKKYALLTSLVLEPEAFVRMLVENIKTHRCTSLCAETVPLVRLNVFSDLPWELMIPDMFDMFGDVRFYDYTKVPNRKPPANYDLTFSYAGTEQNVAAMDFEIREHGRRVAVVFCSSSIRRLYKAQWFDELGNPRERVSGEDTARKLFAKHGAKRSSLGDFVMPAKPSYLRPRKGMKSESVRADLPKTFLGLPVVDGDVSDMRPYDPAPGIVGLTWKVPKNQNVTLEKANVFVVLVDLIPHDGGHYHAIVSKTARFDDVDYSKYAPSQVDQ